MLQGPIGPRLRFGLVCFFACISPLVACSAQPDTKTFPLMEEKGEFTAETPKDRVKTDCPGKPYPLKCVAGRTYTIDLRSADFDAYLRLEDPSGKQIAENDDGGGGVKGTDAQIVFKAERNGEYTIAATSYNGTGKGKYTLTVVHDGAGKEDIVKYMMDKIARLTKDDPTEKDRPGGCYFKKYPIELQAGTTYVIQLDSNDFDAYLRLFNAEGKEVASDDDGAKDGLNAKLVYRCERAGAYSIVATSSAHADTGEFRLRVHAKENGK